MERASVTDRDGDLSATTMSGKPVAQRGDVPVTARRVGQAALALIMIQAAFRGWAVLTGFFYEDDFRYVYDAATSDLSADFLLQDYNGHLMPGEFLVVWLLQRLAPMSFGLVAIVLLLLQVAASTTVWLLLRELVGPRPGALLPLAVYLFSPLTLGSFLWYAASLQAVPLQLVMAGTLLLHIRYLRTRSWRYAIGALSCYWAGLFFWEKALLTAVVVAAVTVLWFSAGGPWQRVISALGRSWRLWLAYLTVTLAYLGLYVSHVTWQLNGSGDLGSTADLAQEAVMNGFVPAIFGGPYTGFPTGLGLAPDPPISVQIVFLQALAVVVVGTIIARQGAWRAWALLAGYLLVDVLLLASGRIDVLGPIIGRDTRYLADASVVASVAVALALFPLAGSPEVGLRPRFAVARLLDRPVVVALALLVYANSCAITSAEMVSRWADTSAEPYVRTAQQELRRLGDVAIYDRQPPEEVLSPWFLEDARVSRILGPLPEHPRFDVPTHDLRVVDEAGRLHPAEVRQATESLAGPVPDCGWSVTGPAGATIRMDQHMYPWRWTVVVNYFAGTSTRAKISLGERTIPVRFRRGLHSLYLVHTGSLGNVRIAGLEPGLTVCVPLVVVGQI